MSIPAAATHRENAILVSAAILLFLSLALALLLLAHDELPRSVDHGLYYPLMIAAASLMLIFFKLHRGRFSLVGYYALLSGYFALSLVGLTAYCIEPHLCFALMSLAALFSGLAVSSRSLALMSFFNIMVLVLFVLKKHGHWPKEQLFFYPVVSAFLLYSYHSIRSQEKLSIKANALLSERMNGVNYKMLAFNKFSELGKLTAGIIHDIINPLAALMLCINDATNEMEKKIPASGRKLKDNLDRAKQAAGRIEGLVESINKQAAGCEQKNNFNAYDETRLMAGLLEHKARKARVKILLEAAKGNNYLIRGNPVKYGQVILNLLGNSIDACSQAKPNRSGLIKISLHAFSNNLNIIIEDNGIGIKDEFQDMVFEPFFTSKQGKGNLGIGLSSIKLIVTDHFGGEINFYSRESKGTCFFIQLPKNSL